MHKSPAPAIRMSFCAFVWGLVEAALAQPVQSWRGIRQTSDFSTGGQPNLIIVQPTFSKTTNVGRMYHFICEKLFTLLTARQHQQSI